MGRQFFSHTLPSQEPIAVPCQLIRTMPHISSMILHLETVQILITLQSLHATAPVSRKATSKPRVRRKTSVSPRNGVIAASKIPSFDIPMNLAHESEKHNLREATLLQ